MKKRIIMGLLCALNMQAAQDGSSLKKGDSASCITNNPVTQQSQVRRTRTVSIEVPRSPVEALQLAQARAQAEKVLGKPVTPYHDQVRGVAEEVEDKCGRNWCCLCGCSAALCIVLFKGCCYKPTVAQVDRAHKALQPKAVEIKT